MTWREIYCVKNQVQMANSPHLRTFLGTHRSLRRVPGSRALPVHATCSLPGCIRVMKTGRAAAKVEF